MKILTNIFKTATFKQSSITTVGTILNGVLGALFYIIVARILGPVEFGLLTISIVTLTLLSDIADIGTNTGLIRFVSQHLVGDRDKAFKFLKLSLEIKLVVWGIAFVLIYFAAPIVATQIFHKSELINPLRLVSIGVGSALLFSFATSSMQAFQKYYLWSGINILTNFLRLIMIFVLGYFLRLNVENSLLVYIILPFFGFFLTWIVLPAKKILSQKGESALAKELFKYNMPVAVFTIISAFSSRLDTYLTASLLNTREVGIYGAANQLVQAMPQLISAIGLVIAPKFASFQNKSEMLIYFKKTQFMVIGISIVGVLAIPVISYFIPIIYGAAYAEAVIPFIFVFLGMLVFLLSIPVHNIIMFYFSRPDIFIWVAIGNLLIIAGFGYVMISSYGIIGAAITVLAGMSFNLIYPLVWLLIKLKK